MKLGIVLHSISNPGGILNHTEQLALGLRELGHEVDLISLEWRNRKRKFKEDFPEQSVFGTTFHAYKGWHLTEEQQVLYKGEHLPAAQEKLSGYDGLIWTVPVPRKRKDTAGNNDWPMLYGLAGREVSVIHDGNIHAYPNLLKVLPVMRGLACVHPCAHNSVEALQGRSELIANPFAPLPELAPGWLANRAEGWIAPQTFKGWKKVGDLVRAARYMSPDLMKIVAGGGIEHCYMTSPDKCKPEYFHEDGERIWDAAMENGMEFLGFITGGQRDQLLGSVTALVDPSWSKRYAQIGSHFNRTSVEALRQGAIPIARRSVTDHEGWWEDGVNYWGIDDDLSPKEYAEQVEEGCTLSTESHTRLIMQARTHLLPKFDRKTVAQQYVDMLMSQEPTWNYDEKLQAKCDKMMLHFEGET